MLEALVDLERMIMSQSQEQIKIQLLFYIEKTQNLKIDLILKRP